MTNTPQPSNPSAASANTTASTASPNSLPAELAGTATGSHPYPASERGKWWLLDEQCTNGRVVASAMGKSTPQELERIALTVAREAAQLVTTMRKATADEKGIVQAAATKSSAVDPVTDVDQASEKLIRQRLGELLPGSAVLGEEDGQDNPDTTHGDGAEILWVVDPIDGTVNFMYGVPAYAVSIAATIDGLPVAAAVIDVAQETSYVAHIGGKARRIEADGTETSLRVNNGTDLSSALVATGFAYLAPRRVEQAKLLTQVLAQTRDIRRMGSAALDLCHVASGTVDAYYEHGLGPWDHAAGVLIAARAGAIVTMPKLAAQSREGLQVIAAKPAIHEQLAKVLSDHTTGGALYPVSD